MIDLEDPNASTMETEAADAGRLEIAGRRIGFIGKLEALNRRDAREFIRLREGICVENPLDAEWVIVGSAELLLDELDSVVGNELVAAAAAGKLEIIPESRFWQIAGLVEDDSHVKRYYTAAMLARLLNVPLGTIRRWHRRGLILPAKMVHRLAYYDFHEVAAARHLAQLIHAGESPAVIEAKLTRLLDWFPDVRRPLMQLSVIVDGRDVLLRRGEGLLEPGGQRRIDFAALENDESKPSDDSRQILATRDFLLENESNSLQQQRQLANALEDECRYAEAILVYRQILLAYGPSAEINFLIGELLYLLGDTRAARERYFVAVELDGSFLEARASLGCVLLETGDRELAISTFRGALAVYPDYADVHFHLARALDDRGDTTEAAEHWRRFLVLAPESPWADEARSRLAIHNVGDTASAAR